MPTHQSLGLSFEWIQDLMDAGFADFSAFFFRDLSFAPFCADSTAFFVWGPSFFHDTAPFGADYPAFFFRDLAFAPFGVDLSAFFFRGPSFFHDTAPFGADYSAFFFQGLSSFHYTASFFADLPALFFRVLAFAPFGAQQGNYQQFLPVGSFAYHLSFGSGLSG
ncbi:hypothetical protein J7438_22565 [Thalassotalea sp. G20_0]|uniref:hypothetical protein n=1 Tax=Thalassotalea sp. G20_0 TaxID=2821093 RepID=UPI001ADCC92B|nr:hypothetical protein [Thalassotalea sp. G20_0]MBO9496847.1 hypothetical protein [Thalassotalea sp. G20_0]